MRWYSIAPTLTSGQKFVSLAIAGEQGEQQEVSPLPLEAPGAPFQNIVVFQETYTSAIAAKLGLGGLGSISGQLNSLTLVYEAMAYTEIVLEGQHKKQLTGTRWGAGLRLVVNVSDISSDTNVDIGFVAAQAQLNHVRASYQISLMGISDLSMISLMPKPGSFDFKSYSAITAATDRVLEYMSSDANKSKMKPTPIALLLPEFPVTDPIEEARSVVFAMRQIEKGVVLEDAKKACAAKNLDIGITEAVYKKHVASLSAMTRDERSRARRWLEAEE